MKYSEVKNIIEFCRGEVAERALSTTEVVDKAINGYDDFEVDGVRFISEDVIDQVWTESLIKEIKDNLSDVPSFVEIDWEQTAENCKVNGMGHHFNSYDGSEDELVINGTLYHVFDTRWWL